jgi:hypothetical protein
VTSNNRERVQSEAHDHSDGLPKLSLDGGAFERCDHLVDGENFQLRGDKYGSV